MSDDQKPAEHVDGPVCGKWGGCTLPKGHDLGQLDVASIHAVPGPEIVPAGMSPYAEIVRLRAQLKAVTAERDTMKESIEWAESSIGIVEWRKRWRESVAKAEHLEADLAHARSTGASYRRQRDDWKKQAETYRVERNDLVLAWCRVRGLLSHLDRSVYLDSDIKDAYANSPKGHAPQPTGQCPLDGKDLVYSIEGDISCTDYECPTRYPL